MRDLTEHEADAPLRAGGNSDRHAEKVIDVDAVPDAERPTTGLERASAEEVVADSVARFGSGLALACSFQKEESVLLHMLLAHEPSPRVFTIDTGVLFAQTREIWREYERRYGLEIEVFDALPPEGGQWSAQRCCAEQKVTALAVALDGLDAWMTGLRREQAPTRADAEKLEWDAAHGLWKVNPLADWTEQRVWSYVAEHDLPYNALHDRGYGSIGCAPCTVPGTGREGRWAGSEKIECGLHVVPAKPNDPAPAGELLASGARPAAG